MPLTLVWGKGFEFEPTALSTGGTYNELFGVDGDSLGISVRSVEAMQAVAAQHGVAEELWPVYPDCAVDENVPLDEVRTRSDKLRVEFAALPSEVIAGDYWLGIIAGILADGHSFFIMA